jgi:hypothetical protein|tara:strand:- start:7594 stop:8439 length:846 start_codon:yes stop_codon:yes gene_type:complete
MKKNFSTIVVLFGLLILLNGVTTTTGGSKVRPVGGCATTTATKTGKEVCKPVSERTFMEKTICWQLKQVGLVCKLDLACERAAHQKTEQEKKEIEKEKEEIEEEKRTQAKCASLGANHLAVSDTKLFQDASDQSKVTTEIKKNDELTLMARVTEEGKKDWIFIFTQDCKQGYVNEKYVKAKIIDDNGPDLGDELIVIIEPRWTKKNKLIVIEKEGPNSLAGRIQSNKIDKIFINGEEEFIESDNSFSKLVNVPKNGLEVRIVGNKDGKKVDSLNFKIQVGY